MVMFDSVLAGLSIFINKEGYYTHLKKAKPILHFRIARKEGGAGIAAINNGLYERPVEHFAGSATVIRGNELRKINPLNFTEGLKYYDPSFIVTRDNRFGDGPNHNPDIKIRANYNFPASATIALNPGSSTRGLQVFPSAGDFVAESIASPDQPVILLDGVQVALQTALDIDINRIESITILKDAAATSVYGVRGGNGVLLMQTKKPQKGNLRVNYSGQVQVSSPNISSYNLMDAAEKLQLEQAASMYANNPSLYQSRLYQVDKGINTNWLSLPLRTGIGSKHSLSMDGGDDDINFGLDFSYNDMQGVMIGEKRQNTAFGGYIGSRFKNFSFSNYLSYLRSSSTSSPYGNFRDYSFQNPYWNPYDSLTGEMNKILEQYVYLDDTVTHYNPAYNGVISTTNKSVYARFSNNTRFNWVLGSGFRLNGQFAISKQSDVHDMFLPPGHTTYADYTPNDYFKRGQYNQSSSNFLQLAGGLQLHYNKKIAFHQFYGSAGAYGIETRSDATGIALSGFTSNKFTDLSFGNAYSNSRPTAGKIITRLLSGFANFTYSYDNRYQLEISGNADGSSQFGNNERVAFHGAVGASWNLHQEKFFQPNKILNQFRVRASIGTAGNQFFQSYLGRTSYNYYTDKQYIPGSAGQDTRGIGLGAYLTGLENSNLKPSQTLKQNLGFDAVLLQNRLALRFEQYHYETTDIVLPIASPSSTGFLHFNYHDNIGAIENSGLEFALTYQIIRNVKKQINWSVSFNGIHNKTRISAISNYFDQLNTWNDSFSVDQTRPQSRYAVGQSLTGIWAVRSLGIDPANGQERFEAADGSTTNTWNAADKMLAGDLSPDWQGSFGSSFSFKNISAGVYFNYQLGAEYYNQTLADKIENADLTYNVDKRAASNRWKQPGDNALYKPLSVNGIVSSPTYATTRFVEKNDFIRCSAISLGYALPQSMAAKIRAQQISLGFIANNVFTSGSRSDEQGTYYPLSRMYTFSVSTTF
jgi:TonB-linked SusC/RagA family outer membrane protein